VEEHSSGGQCLNWAVRKIKDSDKNDEAILSTAQG
jgi:hypothetical protein